MRHSSIMLRSRSGERPLVGSSRISSRGLASSSMAMETRFFCPPESWGDQRFFPPGQVHSFDTAWATAALISALVASWAMRSLAVKVRLCSTVRLSCMMSFCGT